MKIALKKILPPAPHLQPDWAWRSGESSGPFISLLSKQTLLTSGTGLTICSLKKNHAEPDNCSIHQRPRHHNGRSTEATCDTYGWTRCSDGSLRASGTWWALRWRRKMSTKTFKLMDHRFLSRVCFCSLFCFFHSDLHALLCRPCFPSGRALRSLPARVKHNHSVKNPSQRQRKISRDSEQR